MKLKSVLSIVPWGQVYPPMNGGMLRAMNLLNQVAQHSQLTVLLHQDPESFLKAVEVFPALQNSTVISTMGQREPRDLISFLPKKYQDGLRFRYWNRSLKGPAETNYLLLYRPLISLLKKQSFDFVLLEDMCLLNFVRLIRTHQPQAQIIYDAYNVNSRLAEASVLSGLLPQKNYEQVRKVESSLFGQVDSVITCSEQDLEQLKAMNKGLLKGEVVPNGVGIPKLKKWGDPKAQTPMDSFLFCGSLDYLPNREGLLWFCQEVLPLILKEKPTARLMVVGIGDPGEVLAKLLKHSAIDFYGKVDSVSPYYQKAALAIVPLLSGSGTRLKLLEAMGQGVAVVSTVIGAEGIDYTDGSDILIASEAAHFAQSVVKLLNEPELAAMVSRKAFDFVKSRYDWDLIGEKLNEYLNQMDGQ